MNKFETNFKIEKQEALGTKKPKKGPYHSDALKDNCVDLTAIVGRNTNPSSKFGIIGKMQPQNFKNRVKNSKTNFAIHLESKENIINFNSNSNSEKLKKNTKTKGQGEGKSHLKSVRQQHLSLPTHNFVFDESIVSGDSSNRLEEISESLCGSGKGPGDLDLILLYQQKWKELHNLIQQIDHKLKVVISKRVEIITDGQILLIDDYENEKKYMTTDTNEVHDLNTLLGLMEKLMNLKNESEIWIEQTNSYQQDIQFMRQEICKLNKQIQILEEEVHFYKNFSISRTKEEEPKPLSEVSLNSASASLRSSRSMVAVDEMEQIYNTLTKLNESHKESLEHIQLDEDGDLNSPQNETNLVLNNSNKKMEKKKNQKVCEGTPTNTNCRSPETFRRLQETKKPP